MQTFVERLSTLMHHFHSDLLNEYSPKEQEKQTCRRGQTIIMNAYWWLYYLEVIAIWRWTHIPGSIIPNLSIHHHPFHHPSPCHGDVHRVGCCEGGLHRLWLNWSASIEIVKQKHCKTTFQKYFITLPLPCDWGELGSFDSIEAATWLWWAPTHRPVALRCRLADEC